MHPAGGEETRRGGAVEGLPGWERDEFEALKEKIRRERGFNCHHYKDRCLQRRFALRMRVRGEDTVAGYARLLDRDPGEYEPLLDTLTINVTRFFRDPEIWEAIGSEVAPRLFDLPVEEVRVWSAGCASGEEAYSISILLREWAEAAGRAADLERLRILGTDIDARSLEAARRGEYPESSLGELPEGMRARWFTDAAPAHVVGEARRNVSFARRELLEDEPERGQSLILCRNVVIYLDRSVQEELYARFHRALVPGGYLVLGKVETLLGPSRGWFTPVSTRQRIFRKPCHT